MSRVPKPAVANIDNAAIADIFERIAGLLEIEEANPFRIRAYRNAARTLRASTLDLAALLRRGEAPPKLPGIGDDLSAKIGEIVDTGHCALLDRLQRELPPQLLELTTVPGLGPKRVRRLYHELGIENLQQLNRAASQGQLGRLHGFGEKMQARLLQAAQQRLSRERRYPLATASSTAEALVAYLRKAPGTTAVTVAGSYRRMRDTVGDLDVLVVSSRPAEVMHRFVVFPGVAEVLSRGGTRASVVLGSGLQIDLRVVDAAAEGAALVYFTGSKAHNIAIRKRAQARGLKINEYGVFQGERRIAGQSEASVYAALELPPIPPELRESRGEIEAARRHELPHLVERADLQGDLHAHTRASDGSNTLEEMAAAAVAAGLRYLAITDHSKRMRVAHGLDGEALLRQGERIDALNEKLRGLTLLKGVEVDILEDGSLDLSDEVLVRLDIVVGAVHSHFGLPRRQQTLRLQRAIAHPRLHLLAHPFGRLIAERDAIDMDFDAVLETAREHGCALELNCQPQRMDLDDVHCRRAREAGVLVSIDSDAHRIEDFGQLRFGVGQARRGWLEKRDVLNTRSLAELKRLLRR